jgi:transposase
VQIATIHLQLMQKAMDQMNLQLHHVISDIAGQTGIAIIEAILKGERDPEVLAKMRDLRIKATAQTIAAALEGDYRRDHLFTLGQSLQGYRQRQELTRPATVNSNSTSSSSTKGSMSPRRRCPSRRIATSRSATR